MMNHSLSHAATRAAILGLVALATGGCAPLTPRLDADFSQAVHLAIAAQTWDQGAATRNAGKDASGLDGATAKEVLDRYQKSFRAPEPASSIFTIGVSGGSGSR
jgi:hypothetical protein